MFDRTRVPIAQIFPSQTLTKADLLRLGQILAILHARESWITDIEGLESLLQGKWPAPPGQHVPKLASVRLGEIDLNELRFADDVTATFGEHEREAFYDKVVDAMGTRLSRIEDKRGRRFTVQGEVDLGVYGRFALITETSGPALILANLDLIGFQRAFGILKACIPADLGQVSERDPEW